MSNETILTWTDDDGLPVYAITANGIEIHLYEDGDWCWDIHHMSSPVQTPDHAIEIDETVDGLDNAIELAIGAMDNTDFFDWYVS